MQALSIELADETVDALEAERELFGFESRQAYVRWIIDHRGSIEAGGEPDRGRERDRLLADHSERIARLEERVATLSRALEDRPEGDARAGGEQPASDDRDEDAPTVDAGNGRSADTDRRGDADDTAAREPVLEVRGSPRTVRQGPDSRRRSAPEPESESGVESDDGDGASDGERHASSTEREEPTRDGCEDGDSSSNRRPNATADETSGASASLTPERVARIPEDPVQEDAGVLGTVETERLDELTRRAVATTRERLDRDVQTGLEYTSATRLAGDGVRPGEDVTDLDALSIPGRSAEAVEKRRRAVGRALAYLRDEGRARRSDFVDALYAECPAGYETADGWWRCIKAGLRQVDAVEGGEGTRVWRYRG